MAIEITANQNVIDLALLAARLEFCRVEASIELIVADGMAAQNTLAAATGTRPPYSHVQFGDCATHLRTTKENLREVIEKLEALKGADE